MSARAMLAVMIVGTALLLLLGPGWPSAAAYDPTPSPATETPWLTKEAAAQIIGPDGTLGPLFEDVALGGPAPSRAARERIAAFARANHVALDLEVVEDTLVAVRFDVEFGGCCGYEGADVLALRMGRPKHGNCGGPKEWNDDWNMTSERGITLRGRVRFNRVLVRWERTATLAEVLDRADRLLGMKTSAIDRADDHWRETAPDQYLFEMPYEFVGFAVNTGAGLLNRHDLGLQVRAERGTIVEVSVVLDSQPPSDVETTMKARWGRVRISDDVWTWRTSDRVVTTTGSPTKITIAAR
jgi:hypothetical protein